MKHLPLTDAWTLTATGGPVPAAARGPLPAAVPGSVHTDLLAAGAIADPYDDAHETDLEWAHLADWRYTRPLELAPPMPGERVDLVFEGLDTVATVRIAGQVLGRTENMHRSYRFDITAAAAATVVSAAALPRPDDPATAGPGGQPVELSVDLSSATVWAQQRRARIGDRPGAYAPRPLNFVRKMACSFGWDWGPDLRTAGIWKPARIERWSVARLARVRPLVGLGADGAGTVEIHVDLERSGLGEPEPVRLAARVLGASVSTTVAAGETGAVLRLRVPDAPRWWPVGHGAQPLADLDVDLFALDPDIRLDRWRRRIGFRTVEVDTGDDEYGTRFTLLVNGRPIAVRGANWIPDDHLLTRITRERIGRRLEQALGANLNLLRVWGGGIFESEDFYELCDERGILVWQDFLLACSAYPEEEPLRSEIVAEAAQNVVRLMPHPALVVWNGGNENLWGHEDWGWKEQLGGRSWGYEYARRLLADVVAELDPTRPYTPNSPSSPRRDADRSHPNDPDRGTHHQWEVWNALDWTAYSSEIPRFCSEFGFQAPPAWRTLTEHVHAVDGGPLTGSPDPYADPVFLVHQKAGDGTGKLNRGMAAHTGVPVDLADWHWAAQLNQARALRHAVEHYRSWWPRTAGWIVWQLNDCWPVVSWSLVDHEERPKPAWFALRRAAAPRALALVERAGRLSLAMLNDTDDRWPVTVLVRRETFAGRRRATAEPALDVPARSVRVLTLPADLARTEDPSGEVLVAEADGLRAVRMFAEDLAAGLDPDPLEAIARPVPGGYRIEVLARSFAADVTVHPDRLAADARVDDGVLALPAGARAEFLVSTAAELDLGELTRAPVLRTANDLRAVPLRAVAPPPAATPGLLLPDAG